MSKLKRNIIFLSIVSAIICMPTFCMKKSKNNTSSSHIKKLSKVSSGLLASLQKNNDKKTEPQKKYTNKKINYVSRSLPIDIIPRRIIDYFRKINPYNKGKIYKNTFLKKILKEKKKDDIKKEIKEEVEQILNNVIIYHSDPIFGYQLVYDDIHNTEAEQPKIIAYFNLIKHITSYTDSKEVQVPKITNKPSRYPSPKKVGFNYHVYKPVKRKSLIEDLQITKEEIKFILENKKILICYMSKDGIRNPKSRISNLKQENDLEKLSKNQLGTIVSCVRTIRETSQWLIRFQKGLLKHIKFGKFFWVKSRSEEFSSTE